MVILKAPYFILTEIKWTGLNLLANEIFPVPRHIHTRSLEIHWRLKKHIALYGFHD